MREGMKERTNKRTYTTTKHITTLLLRSRIKKEKVVGEFRESCLKLLVEFSG